MELTTRVFVVDDHPVFRQGLMYWLRRQPELTCCGEADSIASARSAVPAARPDLLLLDLQFKEGDGLTFVGEMAQDYPCIRILVVSQFEEDAFAHRALRAGARGYLMKTEATELMSVAIRTVLGGDLYVSRRASAGLLGKLFPDPASVRADLARLSDRELQVFHMLGAGWQDVEIATTLNLSLTTVDTYRENLRQKLLLPNPAALDQTARQWVDTGEFKPPALPQA